ncbi:hypothetical protein SAMN02799630_01723 [Paenibacillus sp. UNCCL117]|nr:hypothetical protein SAMN04488602_104210 [Paenibacillus sp. cl123]SFW29209.1 hypothetical protein SAMN02799630_01723 [Paenibacillus sp. UNCCL117]
MLNDAAHSSVKQALGQGATNNSIGSVNGLNLNNLSSMDIETMLMTVQSNRASLLENQLNDQLAAVQQRNNQILAMNMILSEIYKQRTGQAPYALPAPIKESLKEFDQEAAAKQSFTSAEFDTLAASLKSKIDAIANSQQMDMLRLQSLTNKRNEAFDVMTNFIKKMQDSRSSIIGNMR